MTWAKLDDRANEHEKQLAAGPKACWLWACGLMYCNRQGKKTGRIPKTVVHAGMLFPGLGRGDAKKLVDVGLWHDRDDHYEVHDFTEWNGERRGSSDVDPSLSEKRAEAGRLGGIRSGQIRREFGVPGDEAMKARARAELTLAIKRGDVQRAPCATCGGEPTEGHHEDYSKPLDVIWLCKQHHDELHSNLLEANRSKQDDANEANFSLAHSRVRTRAQPRAGSTPPHPTPGEDPPTPELPVPANGRRKTDRFLASFAGKAARDREDVNELFDDWKAEFGFVEAKLCVGIWNADAETLAEIIDAFGLETCRLVLKHAKNDGMVSGRSDEKREKHESIAYIFGNQTAFQRILRDARQAQRESGGGGFAAVVDQAKRAGAGGAA